MTEIRNKGMNYADRPKFNHIGEYACGTVFAVPEGLFMLASRQSGHGVEIKPETVVGVVLQWNDEGFPSQHLKPGTLHSFSSRLKPIQIYDVFEYEVSMS
jgi:hypothetical protein